MVQDDTNKRGEIKLTGTVAPDHTIQGGYLNNPRTTTNSSGALEPGHRSERAQHHQHAEPCPTTATTAACSKSNLLLEAQLSGRHNELIGGGTGYGPRDQFAVRRRPASAPSTTPRISTAIDAEQRNNRQITGQRDRFLEARRQPRDEGRLRVVPQPADRRRLAVADAVRVRSQFPDRRGRRSGPRRDRTADSGVYAGRVALDVLSGGHRRRANNDSNSLYLTDHWVIGSRLSADLGARYEHVSAESTGDIVSISNNRIVPRARRRLRRQR